MIPRKASCLLHREEGKWGENSYDLKGWIHSFCNGILNSRLPYALFLNISGKGMHLIQNNWEPYIAVEMTSSWILNTCTQSFLGSRTKNIRKEQSTTMFL